MRVHHVADAVFVGEVVADDEVAAARGERVARVLVGDGALGFGDGDEEADGRAPRVSAAAEV